MKEEDAAPEDAVDQGEGAVQGHVVFVLGHGPDDKGDEDHGHDDQVGPLKQMEQQYNNFVHEDALKSMILECNKSSLPLSLSFSFFSFSPLSSVFSSPTLMWLKKWWAG